ncbi:MAG: hypothetical protein JTT11_10140 [Candidatus Brockarchaeota archaeon]|nr:hypothetical protein [Candidatus Brockarchaeota archaeon]
MAERVAEEKINWVLIAAVTIAFSFIGAIVYTLIGPGVSGAFQCMYNFGIMSHTTMLAVGSFLFLILAYPLRSKFNISPVLLTCIYISGLVTSWTLGCNENPMFPASWAQYALYSEGVLSPPITEWWWIPPKNEILNMRVGGMPVNWVAWAPSIFFWSWAFYANFILGLGISSVFRQRWIDVERLPFPLTLSAYEILRRIPRSEGDRNMKPFVVGILLGLAFEVPIFMANIFPWFPDVYSWRINTCPPGVHQVHPGDMIGDNVVGYFLLNKDPIAFGMFFLAPLSVSFSVMIFTLAMMILEQVAYFMGYYTGIFTCGGCARIWYPPAIYIGPPFYWAWVSGIGGAFALTTMVFYHSRSYLKGTLLAALGRPSDLSEAQKKEAMSYRMAYLTVVAGVFVLLGFLLSAGIDILTALTILIVTCFVNQIASVYIYAHTGFPTINECGSAWGSWAMTLRFPEGPGPKPHSQNFVMANWLTENWTDVPDNGASNGLFTTIMAYKMGSLTNVSNKSILRVTVICWLLAIPAVFLTRTWISHVFGVRILNFGNLAAGCELSGEMWCIGSAFAGTPPAGTLALYGAAGFLIVVTLSLMRARFIWWPIDPLGLVIVASASGAHMGVWSAFTAAWVVKTIVLRAGGSKLYENYGVPTVGGFMGGVAIANLFGVAAGSIRFFYPF